MMLVSRIEYHSPSRVHDEYEDKAVLQTNTCDLLETHQLRCLEQIGTSIYVHLQSNSSVTSSEYSKYI